MTVWRNPSQCATRYPGRNFQQHPNRRRKARERIPLAQPALQHRGTWRINWFPRRGRRYRDDLELVEIGYITAWCRPSCSALSEPDRLRSNSPRL